MTWSCTPPQGRPPNLWNVGRKVSGRIRTPGSRARERRRPGVPVEERRADDLERPRRPAPLREVGRLEQALARVDQRGVGRRHVGRRHHPGQPGVARTSSRRRQPRIGTTVRSQSSGCANRGPPQGMPAAHQPRHLADRQPVPHRDRAQAHERLAALGCTVPPSIATPPSGFGRSRTSTATPARAAAAKRQRHRPDVRVVAAADVLQIDDQQIDARPARPPSASAIRSLAVEAGDRNAGARVALVVDADHVLRLAAHAVLGPEQPRRPHARLDQPIDDVDQIGGDAGRVAEQPTRRPRTSSSRSRQRTSIPVSTTPPTYNVLRRPLLRGRPPTPLS